MVFEKCTVSHMKLMLVLHDFMLQYSSCFLEKNQIKSNVRSLVITQRISVKDVWRQWNSSSFSNPCYHGPLSPRKTCFRYLTICKTARLCSFTSRSLFIVTRVQKLLSGSESQHSCPQILEFFSFYFSARIKNKDGWLWRWLSRQKGLQCKHEDLGLNPQLVKTSHGCECL